MGDAGGTDGAEVLRQFSELVRGSPEAIVTIARDLRIVGFSAGAVRLYEMEESVAVGSSVADFQVGRNTPEIRQAIARVLSGEIFETLETVRDSIARGPIVLAISGTPITDTYGSVVGLFAITRDVTAAHAERAALRAAEEQLARSFDEAVVGMAITDLVGQILRVNDSLCQIIGYSREKIMGTTLLQITHPDHLDEHHEVTRALINGEQTTHVRQKRYFHADGHIVWAELHIALVRDDNGEPAHYVAQMLDITERREGEERLRHYADHDSLTGLLNRRAFDRELARHLARRDRYQTEGALLMVDIDNFKFHNDRHGHSAGDQLLITIADCLRSRLRATDAIGRLGGDEFIVLVSEVDSERAQAVAADLVKSIETRAREATGPTQTPITASIGVVTLAGVSELTAAALMERVDRALYEAKGQGRNRYAVSGGSES